MLLNLILRTILWDIIISILFSLRMIKFMEEHTSSQKDQFKTWLSR